MLERARRALPALLAGLFALATGHSATPPSDAERELEAVREKISELQRSMRRDTNRRDALSGQLRDAEENVRDAREVLEYMASIGLAFLTGLLLGKLRYRRLHVTPEPNRLAVFLAELFTTDKDGELGVLRLASRIQKAVATLTPIGTGVASIYAGIKALLGDIG